jgi:outer membrane protein assembly factor BamB
VLATSAHLMWTHEDGGPRRQQLASGRLDARGGTLHVTTRTAPACTMVVGDDDGLFLLRHTAGDGAVSLVERIDPVTLEPIATSVDLAGGPVWPGGLGLHANGDLHVVFGNHAHRLDRDLQVLASRELPRDRPYNSFVTMPDGHLVTKDFGGSRPGFAVAADDREPCELVVLDPMTLEIVTSLVLPEPSIARLSADVDDVYVVGDTSLLCVQWDGRRLVLDDAFCPRYRTIDGQTYGWDAVLAAEHAWFLDDGDGSEGYSGTLRGHGVSTAPLHLVRIDLGTGDVAMAEVCGKTGGLIANPPVVDERRGIVVGYDSGNGVVTAFDLDTLAVRWTRDQDHASHLVLYPESGELVTGDGTDVVVLDIATGDELARADGGGGVQSVLFPCPGPARDVYVCTFLSLSRIEVR